MQASEAYRRAWQDAAQRWGGVVCVATADYDAPQWTNKQHVASRLAMATDVVYVESLGMREPRLNRNDAKRIVRRLKGLRAPVASRNSNPRPPRLTIESPVVLPYHRFAPVRRLNRWLLQRQLADATAQIARPRILWSYAPVVVDELRLDDFDVVVYHCVDDLESAPHLPVSLIENVERQFVERADLIFATSPLLADRWRPINERTLLVGNVADYEHFSRARGSGDVPAEIRSIPRPIGVFIGALSDYKVDWRLLDEVAERLPDWSFMIIGDPGSEERMTGANRLRGRANVHLLGHRDYQSLPDYLRASAVGLVPYVRTPHTAGIFPMKIYEYLAAGLPVVSTDLPALRAARADAAIVRAATADEFAVALERFRTASPARDDVARAAEHHTWDALLAGMCSEVDRMLGPSVDRPSAPAGPR